MLDYNEPRTITHITNARHLIENKYFTNSIIQAFHLGIDMEEDGNVKTVTDDLERLHDITVDRDTFDEAVHLIQLIFTATKDSL